VWSGRSYAMFRRKIRRPSSENFYLSCCSRLIKVAYFICTEVEELRLSGNKELRRLSGPKEKSGLHEELHNM
jgi:hypothetical protein